nr:transglutaminase family protein [Actinomycetales bacterium]
MSIVHVTVSAELDLPAAATIRTQFIPCDYENQRVVSRSTQAPSAVGTRDLEGPDGTRVSYLELPAGRSRIDSAASVRLTKPAYASRRIPTLTWDQGAALIRAIRSTGRTGDGTPVSAEEALYIATTSVPSTLVRIDDDARDLAFSTLSPGQPLILGIAEVAARVARLGLSAVDATHTMIGAMRAVGLAASYLVGVVPDRGIHTWAAVCIPGFSWFPIDPQTARPPDEGAVVLARGRDAADAPLVRCPDGGDGGASVTATVLSRPES